MSAFWKHYENAKPHVAAAVDDVRHKVVEEGWFGKQTTGDIAQAPEPNYGADVDASEDKTEPARHRHHDLYESVWGKEAKTADLYGNAPDASRGPAVGPPAAPAPQGPEPSPGLEQGY